MISSAWFLIITRQLLFSFFSPPCVYQRFSFWFCCFYINILLCTELSVTFCNSTSGLGIRLSLSYVWGLAMQPTATHINHLLGWIMTLWIIEIFQKHIPSTETQWPEHENLLPKLTWQGKKRKTYFFHTNSTTYTEKSKAGKTVVVENASLQKLSWEKENGWEGFLYFPFSSKFFLLDFLMLHSVLQDHSLMHNKDIQ